MKVASSSFKRNSLALAICLIGVLVSYIFFKPQDDSAQSKPTEKPIALLIKTSSDVQKKSKNQLLWVDLKEGDPLFEGDLLRTAPFSYANLKFVKNEAVLKLEPETTVLIEEKNQNLELEMLEGEIFVNIASKDSKINFKTEKRSFEMTQAQMSLNLKSDKVEVNVFEGQVNTNDKEHPVLAENDKLSIGEKGSLLTKNYFSFQKPEIGKDIYIDPNTKTVNFQWEPHRNPYSYALFIGRVKNKMRELKPEKATKNSLRVKIPSGSNYWQIKGFSKSFNFESNIIQSNFVGISSPILLSPKNGEQLYLEPTENINLIWSNQSAKKDLVLEVSKEKDFKNPILVKNLTAESSLELIDIKGEGEYFWRVKGFVNEDFSELTSPVQRFTVKYFKGLKPPAMLTPLMNETLMVEKKVQVLLSWDAVQKAKSYRLTIKNKKDFTINKDTEGLSYLIENIQPGTYTWQVASIGQDGEVGEYSDKRDFTIKQIPKVLFTQAPAKIYFNPEEKFFNIAWANVAGASHYNIQYYQAGSIQNNLIAKIPNVQIPVSDLGLINYIVEAYKNSELLAKSEKKSTFVIDFPLLAAPTWSEDNLANSQTDNFGNYKLAFSQVEGANYYLVEVRDLQSKIIRIEQLDTNEGEIKNLYPGDYNVYLRSVDKYNRKGELSQKHSIKVPEVSGVKKPVLNKVQVR